MVSNLANLPNKIKIVVVGDEGVGKTKLVKAFAEK